MQFKKSQVTLYIIIAIAVVAIFSVIMVTIVRSVGQQFETAETALAETDISYGQFNSYIQSCLSAALDDGLYLIGKQGGFFFENQKGSIVDFTIDSSSSSCFGNEDYNVTYILDSRMSPHTMTGSGYPCFRDDIPGLWPDNVKGNKCISSFSHNMENISYFSFGRYYEVERHPIRNLQVPLCSVQQNIEISNGTHEILQRLCSPSDFSAKNDYSLQNQLEKYIEFRLEECYDEVLEYLTDYLEAEVQERGAFNVEIRFGEKDTTAHLDFPITLNFPRARSTSRSFEYYAQSQVRIKTIYSILYGDNLLLANPDRGLFTYNQDGIIDHDIFNLTYDIERDSLSLLNRFSIFNLSIERCYDNHGTVIRILDQESAIGGEPYEYFIRTKPRRPALDYISVNPSNQYDIYVYEGDSLLIAPLAFDPDDQGKPGLELHYDFIIDSNEWKWREEYFSNNSLYINGFDDEVKCIHPKYGITKNRCTRIELNESDVGSHSMTVRVTDGFGLEDYQVVRVFVDQRPELAFTIENIYGIGLTTFNSASGRSIVSLEDPFIINASDSVFSLAPAYTNFLKWQDRRYDVLTEGLVNLPSDFEYNSLRNNFIGSYPIRFSTEELKIIYPGYSNYSLYQEWQDFYSRTKNRHHTFSYASNELVLEYITDVFSDYYELFDINKRMGYPIGSSGSTSINLTYFRHNIPIESRNAEIYVAECIPYRSDTPSYPFNLLRTLNESREFNPYFANHTCCDAGLDDIFHYDNNFNPSRWIYKSSGTECYDSFEIGTYEDFMDENSNKKISWEIFEELYPEFNLFNPYDVVEARYPLFDRYIRELKGECTGDRGNICHPTKFSIKKIPYCGDQSPSINPSSLTPFYLNWQVRDTMSISSYSSSRFYDGLCICGDEHGRPVIIEIDDLSDPFNDNLNKYCCFDDFNMPPRLSDKPCVLEQCAKFDTTSGWQNDRIGDTVFSEPQSPGPYCQCGNYIADTTNPNHIYCCNTNAVAYEITTECENMYGVW